MTAPDGQPRVAVVLGGGGLKGFAHVGALRAIEEAGIAPARLAGTSIGALIAAAHVGGMPMDQMARRAMALGRRDLFRLNHVGMLMGRLRAESIYLEEPLRDLAVANTPQCTFDALPVPLIVNTVDVARGTIVPWGAPGLTDVSVPDAVYASCALPGFFPPGRVGDRHCVDGGTMDNLPVEIAARGMDLVVAVDVGNSNLSLDEHVIGSGFASVYMRAAKMMMYALQELALQSWSGPPLLLVRPTVNHIDWFEFGRAEELMEEGYRATREALASWREVIAMPGGIFPRRGIHLAVDPAKCTSCGLCVALAPNVMAFDERGKAYARSHRVDWSPNEGDFVRQCPTGAITWSAVDRLAHDADFVTPPADAATPIAARGPAAARPAARTSDAA